jgi:hypothetical protein
VLTGERADRHWGLGRPGAGRSDPGNFLTSQLGHDRKAGYVRCPALIRRHSERRISFQMLDGAKSLAFGYRNVRDGDVVLKVHECLRPTARSVPERPYVAVLNAGAEQSRPIRTPTGTKRCVASCPPSIV